MRKTKIKKNILGFIGTTNHDNFRKPLKRPFERQSLNDQCLTNAKYEELPDLPIIIIKCIFLEGRPLHTGWKDK